MAAPDAQEPYLVAALLCRDFSSDKTLVRLTTHIGVAQSDVDQARLPAVMPLAVFLSFSGFPLVGTHSVVVTMIGPEGQRLGPVQPITQSFRAEEGKTAWTIEIERFGIQYVGDGIYRMQVALNGRVITRVPLHVDREARPTP